jgi:hypothetical protein
VSRLEHKLNNPTVVLVVGVVAVALNVLLYSDLAIKCATHSGSTVGRKIRGPAYPRPIPNGISRFSQARFPAIPNPPMCRRVYDEV